MASRSTPRSSVDSASARTTSRPCARAPSRRERRPAAAYSFARALVLDRGAVDPRVVQRALAAGLTPPDLLQLVAECVFASLVGFVDNLAGRVELDEFLQPWTWK